jgi:hypothetical protein
MQQYPNSSISVGYGVKKVDAMRMRQLEQQRMNRSHTNGGFFAGLRNLFK